MPKKTRTEKTAQNVELISEFLASLTDEGFHVWKQLVRDEAMWRLRWTITQPEASSSAGESRLRSGSRSGA